jgi:hypothetical protein
MPELEIHTLAGKVRDINENEVETLTIQKLLNITKDIYNDILKNTGEMESPESYWQGTVDLEGDGEYLNISNMWPTITISYYDNKGQKHIIQEDTDFDIFKQKLLTPLLTCRERLGCMWVHQNQHKVKNNKKKLKIPNKLYVTFEKNPKIDAAIKKRDEDNAITAQIQHRQGEKERLRDAELRNPNIITFKDEVEATRLYLEGMKTAPEKQTKSPSPKSPPKTSLGTGRGINKKSRKKKVKRNKTKRKRRTVRCSKYKKGKCVSKRQKRKLN